MNKKIIKLLACVLAIIMVGSIFPFSVFAAEDDGITVINESESWYWDGNTLYVYQGQITQGELYNALAEKCGSGTYKYADSKPTLGWTLGGGTEVKSGQTGTIKLSGGTLYVGKKKSTFSWTDYTFTVQTYGYSANFPVVEKATVHMDGNVQAGEQHVTLKAAILASAVKDWGDYAGITPTVYAYDDGTLSTGWHKLEWFIDSALTSGIYPATASRPIKFEWPATGNLPAYTVEVGIVFSDHNRTSNPVVTAPTCTEKGYTTYTCDCGLFTTKGAGTAALGHTWADATYAAPKTCTACGVTEGETLGTVIIPENVTGDVVEEIKNNTALKGYIPTNLPEGAELVIKLVSVGDKIVYDVTPMANGTEVEPTEAITFRLPVPASEGATNAKVYHDGTLMGLYEIKGEGNAKYVEVSSADFSKFAVEPVITVYVAEINGEKYESLADAFAAATAGQTITFVADITEDVTINKAVTIDGAGKTYTGQMILAANSTIKNVNFDGKGYNGYAIVTQAYVINVEDCTAKNYGYGFLNVNSNNDTTTVKNVTAFDVAYGIKIDSCNSLTLDNVKISASTAAVLNCNNGYKPITIKNSELSILGTWKKKAAVKTVYTFEGANKIDEFIIEPDLDTFKLAAGATLTAPEGLTVTTDVENGKVLYEEGKYYVLVGLVGSGTAEDPYQIGSLEDLILFRDSVNAGETKYNAEGVYVTLTADIDMANATWERGIGDGISATFDGIFDGKNFTIKNLNFAPVADDDGYFCGGLFGYTCGAAVIKNLVLDNITVTAEGAGHNVGVLVGFANNNGGKLTVSNVIVKNVTINAPGVYGVGAIVGYSYREMGTIEKCTVDGATITGYSFVGGITGYSNSGAVISECTVKNATIIATSKGAGGVAGIVLSNTTVSNNVVENTTVTATTNWGYVIGEVAAEGVVVANNTAAEPQVGGNYSTGEKVQAKIGNKYYTTFAAAYEAAVEGDTITLLAPIVVNAGETLELNKNVTISYTSNVAGEDMITVRGKLIVDGATLVYNNTDITGSNVTVSTISCEPGSVVEIKSGTVKNVTVKANGSSIYSYAIDMLTNGNLGDVTVTVSGGTVYSDYMAIRQFNNGAVCKNTLTVEEGGYIYGAKRAIQIHMDNNAAYTTITGGKVEGGDYALCFLSSSANITVSGGEFIGAVYSGTNAIISGGTFSTEVYAGYLADGKVLTQNTNGTYSVVTSVAKVNGVEYATLAAAIKAATDGQTITLLADVNENVTINKGLTIDGADKNYTGTMTISVKNATITIKNVKFVQGNIENTSTANSKETTLKIEKCDFDGQNVIFHTINVRQMEKLEIVDCNVKNAVTFVYVPGALDNDVIIRNTTVDGMTSYAVRIGSGCAAQLYGVTIKNTRVGVFADTAKNYVISNCTFENVTTPINTWKGTTPTGTFSFEGVSTVPNLRADLNVINGVQIGTKIYGTLAEAWAAAQDGDTIKLLGDIAIDTETFTVVDGKKITLDMNGKKITVTDNKVEQNSTKGNYELFYVLGELTVTGDGTIELTAETNRYWNAMSVIFHNRGGVLTIENGTFTHKGGTDMAFVVDNSGNWDGVATTNINGGTLYSTYTAIRNRMDKAPTSSKVILNVTGGKIDGATSAIWAQASSSDVNNPATGEINISGGEIGIINTARSAGAVSMTTITGGTVAGFKGESGELTVNGGKITGTITILLADGTDSGHYAVKDNVYYTATAWINKVGYFATLADAVEYVNEANKTSTTYIYLLCDSEGPGFVVKKPVQIEFEGYTYTITSGVGSTGTESNGIQQLSGKLVLKNGTLKVADSIASTMYILVQSYDDLSVIGMTLDGTNLDKWSKHEDQVVNGDSYVVSKNNGNFSINTTNIITNNDGSKAFAFDLCDQRAYGYMDLPYASVAATTTINGVPVKESLDKVEAAANYSIYYYATIEQAIAKHPSAALIGDVILKDTVVIPEGKTFTLDLNGHTITMKTAEYKSAIVNNGTLTVKDSGENGGIAMIFNGTPSTAVAVNTISNRGKLTVQGGNISNTGSGNQIGYAIDNYNGATLTVKGGNITASGSTYYDAIRLFCGSKETKVTVSGGYISSIWAQNPSANKASEVNGSVVVTGGEIGTIYYENYTTVTITTKIAGNYNVVAYGANSENATSAKYGKNTVYSFAN